jgi:uncharacterized protein
LPPARERTRFVADAMLGTLARKLRALGFDTSYYKTGEDGGLLGVAIKEGRTVLTSDRALAGRATRRGVSVVLLSQKSDGARISAIARVFRESGLPLERSAPLCSLCGGELEVLQRKDVQGRVPKSVQDRHRLFYRCEGCGHIYWRGSHWKKLRSLARRLT